METLTIANPFPGAACFSLEETPSTMDEARRLARMGFPAGTVLWAERQTAGRGRLPGRVWEAESGAALLCTLILDGSAASLPGLSLRIGLALARTATLAAIRAGARLSAGVALKWPNDVLIGGKKLAGILCEAAEGRVFVGFGLNVNQRAFPPGLADKATSLALATGERFDRGLLLELVLGQIALALGEPDWRAEIEALLWRRGEWVRFAEGLPEGKKILEGELLGLGPEGGLLIQPASGGPSRSLLSGELLAPTPGKED